MPTDEVNDINLNDTTNTMELKSLAFSVGTGYSTILAANQAGGRLNKVVNFMVSYVANSGAPVLYTLNHGDDIISHVYIRPGENVMIAKSEQPIYCSGYELKHKASVNNTIKVSLSYQEIT